MSKTRLSQRQYAAHRGVSLRAVQKALESGRIKADKNGKIDPTDADRSWALASDPSKQRGAQSTTNASEAFAKARAAREAYNAKLAKLNYEQRSSRLVDAAMVRMRAFENARAVRDTLLNIPNRISAELASETDPLKVQNMLTLEITRVLAELTGMKEAEARKSAAAAASNANATELNTSEESSLVDEDVE